MRPRPPLAALALLIVASAFSLRGQEAPSVAGHWEGEIEIPGMALQVLVDLEAAADGWRGTIAIPMQGARGLPLTGIEIGGERVRFAIQGVPGDPTFDGTLAQGEIRGRFTQGGATFPFRLGREPVALPARPQEPRPPFPYDAEEVSYQNGEITLAGTLTLPRGAGPFPAALLLTGSGPQNRDEEILGHKPFLVLADHLTRSGVAVLRVDDRGVGGSTGDVQEATTADFAEDALAGVRFLRAHPKIAADRVGLVGHSEGALVAPLAASRSPEVAFVVLLAGPGVPGREVLARQTELIARADGAQGERLDEILALQREAVEVLLSDADPEARAERLRDVVRRQLRLAPAAAQLEGEAVEAYVEQAVESSLAPWFRFFLTYDPRPALRQVKVPVLAVNGALDLQVDPAQNLPEVGRALLDGGNLDVTLRQLPGLNHLFQTAGTGSPLEYARIEETFSPRALSIISRWLAERFVPTPPPPPP